MDEEYNQPAPVYPQTQFGLPISQNLEVIDLLIRTGIEKFEFDEDGDIRKVISGHFPPDMVEYFWGYINPDLVITNFEEKDVRSLMEQCKASRKLYLKTIPPRYLTHERIRQLDNLEAFILARLRRSLHGFERQKMTEQTQQIISGQVSQQPQKRSFVQNIGGSLFRV
jgi:hypothetical protein